MEVRFPIAVDVIPNFATKSVNIDLDDPSAYSAFCMVGEEYGRFVASRNDKPVAYIMGEAFYRSYAAFTLARQAEVCRGGFVLPGEHNGVPIFVVPGFSGVKAVATPSEEFLHGQAT